MAGMIPGNDRPAVTLGTSATLAAPQGRRLVDRWAHCPATKPVASSETSQRNRMPTLSGDSPLHAHAVNPDVVPAEPFDLPVGSTAVVYCEAQFGEQDGKTANGLVRHSEKYEILSVLDSRHAGLDAGVVPRRIAERHPRARGPRRGDRARRPRARLPDLRRRARRRPALGRPAGRPARRHRARHARHQRPARVPQRRRRVRGRGPASPASPSPTCGGRRPSATCTCSPVGSSTSPAPRIAVLGTDGAIGKRTTATLLVQALNDARHQGRHGRHRADHADPGREVRRRAGRDGPPVHLRRGRAPGGARRSRARTPT